MKILLVSDLHSQPKALRFLDKIVKKELPEAIIISGDLCNGDDFEYWEKTQSQLKVYDSKPLLIWGNNEGGNIIKQIRKSSFCIHLRKVNLGKFNVFGISETDQPQVINPDDIKNSILVTHRPPAEASMSTKMDNAPYIHISGHVHSCARKRTYPSTTHICVPSLQSGRYGLLDPEEISIDFFKISQ